MTWCRSWLAGCIAAVVLSGGCGEPRSSGDTDTQAAAPRAESRDVQDLRERATALWTALASEDWKTRYALEEPRVQKEVPEEEYIRWCVEKEPFTYVSFHFFGVETEGDMGWVDVERALSVRKVGTAPTSMRVWQKWRRVDGAWYPVPTKEVDYYPSAPSLRDLEAEQALARRFQEAWEQRKSGNCTDLYAFLDPRDLAGRSVEDFCKLVSEKQYLDYTVNWIEVIGNKGRIVGAYKSKINDPNLAKMPAALDPMNEHWVLHEDRWYIDVVAE
jgi:hypothetical protein